MTGPQPSAGDGLLVDVMTDAVLRCLPLAFRVCEHGHVAATAESPAATLSMLLPGAGGHLLGGFLALSPFHARVSRMSWELTLDPCCL